MKKLFLLILFFAIAVCTATAGEREVALKRDFGTLRGTLCTPEAGSEIAVLFVAGSGPTDRNCNSTAGGLYTNSFGYIAQALEAQGIASLRYDKRGISASHYDDPQQMMYIAFDDYVGDAAAWVAWLRAEGFKKVIIAGHSEGSLIALCTATGIACGRDADTVSAESANPDALILLAGAGMPLDAVLITQLSAQLAMTNPMLLTHAMRIVSSLRQGKTVENYPKELEALFHPYAQRYWISEIKHNPQELIARVKIPVLIVNGDNDIQVSVANAETLHEGKPDAELLIIKGMTHILKQSNGHDAQSQMAVYMDATHPLDPTLAEALPRFILKHK